MAAVDIESVIKKGVERALNEPIMNGKSVMQWAEIGMAAPQVVRCKDCKHWRQLYGDKPFYSHIGCCDCDDMWRSLDGETTEVNDIRTDSDFYCGYAEGR